MPDNLYNPLLDNTGSGTSSYLTESKYNFWDKALPPMLKDAYNKSITGMAHAMYKGKDRFDLPNYHPGAGKDIAAHFLGMLIPTDMLAMLAPGGLAVKATRGLVLPTQKGFANTASKLLAKKGGMSKAEAYKALDDVIVRGSQNAAMFGAYEGFYDAAEAGREAIISNGISLKHLQGKEDEVFPLIMKKGLKGLFKGATLGQLSGVARSLRWTGGYGKVPGVRAFKGTEQGGFLNEMAAFGAFAPVMEGRVPGFQDFALAGATLGAMKTAPVIKGGLFSFGKQLRKKGDPLKSEPFYIAAVDDLGNPMQAKEGTHVIDKTTGKYRLKEEGEVGTHILEDDVAYKLSEAIIEGIPEEILNAQLQPSSSFFAKNITEKIREKVKKGKSIFIKDEKNKKKSGLEIDEATKKGELRGSQVVKSRMKDPNNLGKTRMQYDLDNPIAGRLWLGRNGATVKQFVEKDGKLTGEVIIEMSGEGGKVRYLLDEDNALKLFDHYTDDRKIRKLLRMGKNSGFTAGEFRTKMLQKEIKDAIGSPDKYGTNPVEVALANADAFLKTQWGKQAKLVEKYQKFVQGKQKSMFTDDWDTSKFYQEWVSTLSQQEQFVVRKFLKGSKDRQTYFNRLTEVEKQQLFYQENPNRFSGPVSSFLGAFRSGMYNLEDTAAQKYLRYIDIVDGNTTVLQGERLADLSELLDFRFMKSNKRWNAYIRGESHKGKRIHSLKEDMESTTKDLIDDIQKKIRNSRSEEMKAFHNRRLATIKDIQGLGSKDSKAFMNKIRNEAKRAGVPVARYVQNYFPGRIRKSIIERLYKGDKEVAKMIRKEMGESFATMTDTEPLTKTQEEALNGIITQYIDKIEAGLGPKGQRASWTQKQKDDEHYLRLFNAIQQKLGPNASKHQVHLAIRYGSYNHTLKPYAALEKRRKPVVDSALADIDFTEIANEVDAAGLQEIAGRGLKGARESIMETDALVVLTDYVAGATKRQVQVETFGVKGEILDKIAESISPEKRLRGAPKMVDFLGGYEIPFSPQTEKQAVELMKDVLTGEVNMTGTSTTAEILSKVAQLEMIAKINLGMATIPNVTQQFISTMVSAGYWRFGKAMHKLVTDKPFRQDVSKKVTVQSMIDEFVGPVDASAAAISGTEAKAQTSMQRFISLFTKGNQDKIGTMTQLTGDLSLFNSMNRWNQIMAGATAEVLIKDLSNMALGKKGTGAFGILDTLAPSMRKKYARNKLQRLGFDVDGLLKGPGKGKLAEDKYNKEIARVMLKFAKDSQLQRSFTKDPFLFNNPHFKPFLLFKRFGYRQAQYVYEQSKAEFLNGNVVPILSIGLSGMAGMAFVQPAKAWITKTLSGDPEFSTRNRRAKLFEKGFGDVTFDKYLEALSAVGGFGMVGDLVSDEDWLGTLNFALKPVMFDDLGRLSRSWGTFIKSADTFHPSMKEPAIRALSVAAPAFGGIPSRIVRRLDTPKMEKDRATQRKRDAIQAAKDYIINNNPSEASKLVNEFNQAWGPKYPSLRIEFEDFSVNQIMKDYAKKVKRKQEEWEYKP